MSGCLNAGRPGCRGTLCLSAHSVLRHLPVARYPSDALGRPDLNAQAVMGWVCAVVSFRSPAKSAIDIPGTAGGNAPMHLTAAAGSLEPPLAPGDRVQANGLLWRAGTVTCGQYLTAELLPEEA